MKAKDNRNIHRRAQALIKRKRFAEAISVLKEATRNSRDTRLLCTLGGLLAAQGEQEEALRTLQRALSLDPDRAETHRRLGGLWAERGENARAEAAYRRALALQPAETETLLGLGGLYLQGGMPEDAAWCYRNVLEHTPRSADAHFGLSAALARTHQLAPAIDHLQQAAALQPRSAETWQALGVCAERALRYDLATQAFTRAAALRPRDPDAAGNLARALEHLGEHQAALQQLEPFLEQQPDAVNFATAFARIAPHCGRVQQAIGVVRHALGRQKGAHAVIELLFHLGQLHDKSGDYEQAFQAFSEGNRLSRTGFDRDGLATSTDHLISTFDSVAGPKLPRSAVSSEKPVFVVGMPRSGTTLVEQILASHPRVHGAGELKDLSELAASLEEASPEGLAGADPATLERMAGEHLRRLEALAGSGCSRIIDKMPTNFRHLGLISLLFPGARVIHCIRDPMDTCLSILSLKFDGHHPYAYDQEELGFYYRQYRRLMAHWKRFLEIPILDVHYERLVGEPEAQSRRMVEFLGLEWDDACLRFHESGRKAHTASYDQVRRPIYTSSVQRWRHYEKHLGPLLAALGEYAPAADPAHPA